MEKINSVASDAAVAELVAIKRLIVYFLLRSGATQKEVAAALGVDQSHVSRMFSGSIGVAGRKSGKVK